MSRPHNQEGKYTRLTTEILLFTSKELKKSKHHIHLKQMF